MNYRHRQFLARSNCDYYYMYIDNSDISKYIPNNDSPKRNSDADFDQYKKLKNMRLDFILQCQPTPSLIL